MPLNHITLIVADPDRSARIVTDILGGSELYDSKGRNFSLSREKFFDVDGLWLVLMEGAPCAEKTYNHIAFSIDREGLAAARDKIRALGLELKDARSRVEGEGDSLYFYDYDNHLFELHSGTLQQRLARYRQG